jgi:hypothetical protein
MSAGYSISDLRVVANQIVCGQRRLPVKLVARC